MAATLTPSATTGNGVIFTASQAVFLQGDVGRQIIFQAARALIVGSGVSAGDTTSPNTVVRADILNDFPDTNPIAVGAWFLRLSPQAELTPDKKQPIGTTITLTADRPSFRAADVNKFIDVHSGLVRLTEIVSTTVVKGIILSALSSVTEEPPEAAVAGAWFLKVSSWSPENGFPRTAEFFNNRLAQAGTYAQRTTIWLSQVDNYDNYAIGVLADDAVDYTIASRRLNRIEWLADNIDLFVGTSGAEFILKGSKPDEPIGGDVIPRALRISDFGSAPMMPIVLNGHVLFVDRSQLRIFALVYSFEDNGYKPVEVTVLSDHITQSTVRLEHLSLQQRLDLHILFVRTDGTLISLTYYPDEKVIGFARLTTEGTFESKGVIPQTAGRPDQIYVIAKRIINGQTARMVEVIDEQVDEVLTRDWQSLQTDCALVYKGTPVSVLPVPHLEGKTVDIVADGGYRGQVVVTAGAITMPNGDEYSEVEVGLHYRSEVRTLRPAIKDQIVDGLSRSWKSLFVKLKDSVGGTINDVDILYTPDALNLQTIKSGDFGGSANPSNYDLDGRVTIKQDQPYPFTLLSTYGTIEYADHD